MASCFLGGYSLPESTRGTPKIGARLLCPCSKDDSIPGSILKPFVYRTTPNSTLHVLGFFSAELQQTLKWRRLGWGSRRMRGQYPWTVYGGFPESGYRNIGPPKLRKPWCNLVKFHYYQNHLKGTSRWVVLRRMPFKEYTSLT